MKKLSMIILIIANLFCTASEDENKAKLAFPQVTSILSPSDSFYFFYPREIDKTLTTNCGIATPGTISTPGVPGTPTVPTTGTTGTASSRRTILSQLVFKTGETLTMKFLYDSNQFQGALDQQQGFTLTGGIFGHTVTGRQGTVKWSGQSLGYIDESNTAAQALTFLMVDINLRGTFTPGATNSGIAPVECNTSDGTNCTSSVTTTKCFTDNNKTCMTTSSTTGTPVTISGSINCNATNVIPQ